MGIFSNEGKFCQNFKVMRENAEVYVIFNIDGCQSILNDKITAFLYYNNKLDVENEKDE